MSERLTAAEINEMMVYRVDHPFAVDGPLKDASARLLDELVVCRVALRRCRDLFSRIRGDWTDPRSKCREGWEIIDEALNPRQSP